MIHLRPGIASQLYDTDRLWTLTIPCDWAGPFCRVSFLSVLASLEFAVYHTLTLILYRHLRPFPIVVLTDCAVCEEEYGRGVSNSCHFCDDTTAHVLVAIGTLFSLVVILLLFLAAVFLVGGLDAIDIVRQTVSRNIPFGSNSSAGGISVPKTSLRSKSESLTTSNPFNSSIAPAFAVEPETQHAGGGGGIARGKVFPTNYSEGPDDSGRAHARPLGAVVGIELSDMSGKHAARGEGVSPGRHARISADTAGGVGGAQANRIIDSGGAGDIEKPMCCGLGDKVKRWLSRLPLDKLKILVVVWQILTVFSGITGVEFPATYSRFLSWINVVNLDIGNIFSASCILPSANFYARLLVTTLTPLVLASVLVLTYRMAKRRAGIGRAGVIARRAAWSRHVAAGLLLTFLVSHFISIFTAHILGKSRKAFRWEAGKRGSCSLSMAATTRSRWDERVSASRKVSKTQILDCLLRSAAVA